MLSAYDNRGLGLLRSPNPDVCMSFRTYKPRIRAAELL